MAPIKLVGVVWDRWDWVRDACVTWELRDAYLVDDTVEVDWCRRLVNTDVKR